jgi:hypothetical protein
MARQNETSNLLVQNAELLIEQLGTWFWPTVLIGAAIVAVNLVQLSQSGTYTIAELGVATIAVVSGLAFLKASWIFTFYPMLYRRRFEGSSLIVALLVTVLLINTLGATSYLAIPRLEGFPVAELPWLLAGAYVFVSLFLWANFRLVNWLFGSRVDA